MGLGQGMFWRLLVGTVVMLAAGYAGEAQVVPAMVGFIVGMLGWGFILYEIFAGEAGNGASDASMNKYVQQSFGTMRLIVTAGWSIYPLGYFFGYLMGAVDDHVLNLVYNLADFVNKIAFLPCHLAGSQEQHPGAEGGSPPASVTFLARLACRVPFLDGSCSCTLQWVSLPVTALPSPSPIL